jgi:hypothetical protein
MPTPAVDGTPSFTPDPDSTTDPLALVRHARGQDDAGFTPTLDRSPDDSWTRGPSDSQHAYFEPSRDKGYRNGRQELPQGIDYGAAADVVERTRRLRDELDDAKRDLTKAVAAIKPAELQDRRETVGAVAAGHEHRPVHAKAAHTAREEADRRAAVALHRAIEVEPELRDVLRANAWAIRDHKQLAVDDTRADLARALADAQEAIIELDQHEQQLGAFERVVLADAVDPDLWIDLRPAGAGSLWQATPGSPHGETVRDVLSAGRRLQRRPSQQLDAVRRWVDSLPISGLVRAEVIRTSDAPRPTPVDAA